MKKRQKVPRRTLLKIVSAGLVSLFFGHASSRPAHHRRLDRLLNLSKDRDAAVRAGRFLQTSLFNTSSVDDCLCRIFGNDWAHILSTESEMELIQRLLRKRREDYRDGRVVKVDGWRIAQCEADFCIIAAQSS